MKTYTFEVVIHEGNGEFWKDISEVSGISAVTQALTLSLLNNGWGPPDCTIKLREFKDDTKSEQ